MPRPPEKSVQNDFLKKVENTITTFDMVQSQDSILVCVSGGPDSVALLYALNRLSSRLPITLGIAHINHQLRAVDSEIDQQFVISLAQKMGLPAYIERCDVQQYGKKNRGHHFPRWHIIADHSHK